MAGELSVKLEPASVLFDVLLEMIKLDKKATFIVTQDYKIQILISMANAFAILDMEPDQILCKLDRFSLRFDLHTWLQALCAWIVAEPDSSAFITKSPGSMDLFCSFGEYCIELGEAEFVKQDAINLDSLVCLVRVTMTPKKFKDLIESIISQHEHKDGVSAVQIQINKCYISHKIRENQFYFSIEEIFFGGKKPRGYYRFKLRWDALLFKMLSTASNECLRVELSVLVNSKGCNLYRFRFFFRGHHVFCYVEKEP